jgi:hypothetical protein
MTTQGNGILSKNECKQTAGKTNLLSIFIIILVLIISVFQCMIQTSAAPVIIQEEGEGSWSDGFEDTDGVSTLYNISIDNSEAALMDWDNLSWTYEYHADVEPESDGWTLFESASGDMANATGGILTIDTTTEDAYWYYTYPLGGSNSVGTTLEARVKVESAGSDCALYLVIRDGTYYEGIKFYTDRIETYVDPSIGTYFLDTTDKYHTYRLTAKNNDFMVYVDGVLKLNGTGKFDNLYAANLIQFGDTAGPSLPQHKGRTHWDYIKFNNSGAFIPTSNNYSPKGNLTSNKIALPFGYMWGYFSLNKTDYGANNSIKFSILDGETNDTISGFENLSGSGFDISTIDPILHPTIRLYANFTSNVSMTPVLYDWSVTWEDITPPDTPMGLSLSNPWTGYSLIISWESNTELDFSHYRIYSSFDNLMFSWLTDVPDGSVSFVHYGLVIGQTQYYKIAAFDINGNPSSNTSVVFGTPDIDTDGDQIGNIVDTDDDGDTVPDLVDEFPLINNEWIDTDLDGIGNNADYDDDADGYDDTIDEFPLNDTEWADLDNDGIGDNSDEDKDGDGVIHIDDVFPMDPTEWEDTDSDGIGDNKDLDIDGDDVHNINDAFPYADTEWNDLDGDGTGDNSDSDRDGDGITNSLDAFPDNLMEWHDTDSDGVGDNADSDDDGDGYVDINDAFPYDQTEWTDMDSDGIGDNTDSDIDGDGITNNGDIFPFIANEWKDYDSDGVGDNSDLDDDNDKHPDTNDDYPYDSSKWKRPNELLPWLYLLVVLLIILIIIGIILMLKSKKEPPRETHPQEFEAGSESQTPFDLESLKNEVEKKEPPKSDDVELPPPPPSE